MIDRIVNMEALGGRKPSELLAAMNKLRPKEDHHFFAYHFLQRMPWEVRVLLSQDCCKDMQALAEKADVLMALHLPQQHDVTAVALVTAEAAQLPGEEDEIAVAIQKGQKKKKKQFKKFGKKLQEELKLPLGYFHIRYGDKAHHCEEPCAWPVEN
jgi:hypothetical protein